MNCSWAASRSPPVTLSTALVNVGIEGSGQSAHFDILLALFELFIDAPFRLLDVLDEPPGGKQGAAKQGESEEKNQDFKPHLSELTRRREFRATRGA